MQLGEIYLPRGRAIENLLRDRSDIAKSAAVVSEAASNRIDLGASAP